MPETTESLFIDTLINNALNICRELPESPDYLLLSRNIRDLKERLAHGRLHLAVLGQFNRGKSTFINALLGMEILPTSVLPITSVPTVISYGERNESIISFSDEKEDAVVQGDAETIVSHLDSYVTEKNNPKNHLCVFEAIVKCKSPLLEHGTVIVDTPGFGSTLTHNTRTTLDLLASCDAALFLLSADLPITQVEIDFLKSVIKTVPRLFFVYNKTDLLSKKELEVSEQFIKDTLKKSFDFPLGVRLFPVSAKKMEKRQKDDKAYVKSGLAAVEKEILEFLLREKYFTLSEALAGKFKDALAQIRTALENSRNELLSPINEVKERLDRIELLEKSVTNEIGKALSLSEAEETALYEYADTLLIKNKEKIHNVAVNRLSGIIDSVTRSRHYTIIHSALSQLFEEMFSRLFVYFIHEQGKPLRNAAAAHIRELVKLGEKVEKELGITIETERVLKTNIEYVEIDASETWKPKTQLELLPPRITPMERFYSNDRRYTFLFEHYSPQLPTAIDSGLEELLKHVNNLISSVFELLIRGFRNDYNMLMQIIKEKKREEEVIYKEITERAEPELSKLTHLIEGFSEVKEMIV